MIFNKENLAKRAYKPYHRAALHCLPTSVLILLLSLVASAVFEHLLHVSFLLIFLPVLVLFAIMQILLEYRVSLISLLENKRSEWVTEELTIQKIVEEYDFSSP